MAEKSIPTQMPDHLVKTRVRCRNTRCEKWPKERVSYVPPNFIYHPVLAMHTQHGSCGLNLWVDDAPLVVFPDREI